MKNEEITHDDFVELERLVAEKEADGWTREGEREIVHSEPDENGVDYISYLQVMTKNVD